MLFGVLIGSVDWFAGNVTEKLVYYIMNSLGFNDHSYMNLLNLVVETTTLSSEGITMTSTTTTYPSTKVAYDYKKLLKMLDYWFDFFLIYRTLIFVLPFVYFLTVELGVALVFTLLFLFMY